MGSVFHSIDPQLGWVQGERAVIATGWTTVIWSVKCPSQVWDGTCLLNQGSSQGTQRCHETSGLPWKHPTGGSKSDGAFILQQRYPACLILPCHMLRILQYSTKADMFWGCANCRTIQMCGWRTSSIYWRKPCVARVWKLAPEAPGLGPKDQNGWSMLNQAGLGWWPISALCDLSGASN